MIHICAFEESHLSSQDPEFNLHYLQQFLLNSPEIIPRRKRRFYRTYLFILHLELLCFVKIIPPTLILLNWVWQRISYLFLIKNSIEIVIRNWLLIKRNFTYLDEIYRRALTARLAINIRTWFSRNWLLINVIMILFIYIYIVKL